MEKPTNMTKKIIECVPNVSEGQNTNIINKIANIIRQTESVKLLDYSKDPDHDRSVFTFTGSPSSVFKASLDIAKFSIQNIDIRKNKGVHPKIGAIDIIPFIPVLNTDFDDCWLVAKKLKEKLQSLFEIPIFFYKGNKRQKTDHIENKGIYTLPELRKQAKTPSCKENFHPTAGAIAIGVRDFLIAYNINLATNNLKIAQKIVSKIRERNGGLTGVRALAFFLQKRNLAQVSMNLTTPEATTKKDAFQFVEKECRKLDIKIHSEEIIGCLPEDVMNNLNAWIY